ncbi:hypothetical protein PPROV_000266300 [Pycnococcus provasolii]|uniref:Corrinoid adenosyltransferase MMAB n=1 Tax=Pycnococcus provasolii TaxID=41880 RepID=A0A830HEY1_9CHLO|nr:hypothetical protein PPROV_000266300 [Pycnococcus provasolii]
MKIYTRTGDAGESSLYNGERRRKDDLVFEALGDVDELNSVLGVCRHLVETVVPSDADEDEPSSSVAKQLTEIQSRLLDAGSAVATPLTSEQTAKLKRARFPAGCTEQVEAWIDALDAHLPPLTNFILPSGGAAASQLHLARTVCRRAERKVARLTHELKDVEPEVLTYVNRLSDYLFTAARVVAKVSGATEVCYKKV